MHGMLIKARRIHSGSWIPILGLAVLLLSPLSTQAAPTSEYVKCEKFLTRYADTHTEKAEKLRRHFETKYEKILQAQKSRTTRGITSNEELVKSIKRLRRLRNLDQAHEAYVTNVNKAVFDARFPDGPDFICLPRTAIVDTYKVNFEAYQKVFQLLEQDIEERLELEQFKPDEGLVIVAYNSTEPTNFARLNRRGAIGGNIMFGPVRRGEHFRIMRAKPGTYNWDEIEQKITNGRRYYNLSKMDLDFVVEAGKLNYTGVFLLEYDSGYFSATLNDRLVITLTALEQRYPEFIDLFPFANGLQPDDRFTEFYLSEKRLADAEARDAQ